MLKVAKIIAAFGVTPTKRHQWWRCIHPKSFFIKYILPLWKFFVCQNWWLLFLWAAYLNAQHIICPSKFGLPFVLNSYSLLSFISLWFHSGIWRFLYCYNILVWMKLWWNKFVASNCVLALKIFLHKFNPISKCRNLEMFFYIGKYFLLYSIMLSIFFCYEQQQFKGCLKLLNLETCSQMTLIRFS